MEAQEVVCRLKVEAMIGVMFIKLKVMLSQHMLYTCCVCTVVQFLLYKRQV
jgi:hypothetical protein